MDLRAALMRVRGLLPPRAHQLLDLCLWCEERHFNPTRSWLAAKLGCSVRTLQRLVRAIHREVTAISGKAVLLRVFRFQDGNQVRNAWRATAVIRALTEKAQKLSLIHI